MCEEELSSYLAFAHTPKFEYWSFNVPVFMHSLVIHVSFRDGYKPVAHPGAWIGEVSNEDRVDSTELSRITSGFTHSPDWSWVNLEIEKPLIGFSYAIYWTPPKQIFLEAARNM
jgi:hypothetical protein